MNSKTKAALMVCPLALLVHQAIYAADNTLETINVNATADTKAQQGKDDVYLKDQVTEYKSKKEIEAYRGNSVGDLLSGFSGTYSGDVRNGGAIDPIIRGSWGQGRIPVLVDGTEQAITVWRGFAGVSNRNYLDPFLISGVTVEKGAVLDRSLRSGSAGTIRMNTLEVDDIVKAGKKWGVEIKTEAATNAIKGLQNKYQFGGDYRDVPDGLEAGFAEYALFFRQNDRVQARSGNRLNPKNDKAVRIVAAFKEDHIEGLAAYAYRDKGNYYAGKHGAHKYGENLTTKQILEFQTEEGEKPLLYTDDPYVPLIGKTYPKTLEVPNTSYHSESWLGKVKFKFNDDTTLKLGIRHSDIRYGDIMPSRLIVMLSHYGTIVQWPEASVKQTALNLDFSYNPEHNKWLNLTLGGWAMRNKSATNTSGGTPGETLYSDKIFQEFVANQQYSDDPEDSGFDYDENGVIINNSRYYEAMRKLVEQYKKDPNRTPNTYGVFNMRPTQVQFSKDNYWGINASNRMEITPKLTFDVMANYRRETLDSTNLYELWDMNDSRKMDDCLKDNKNACRISSETRSGARKGNRHEFNAGFNLTYRPTNWLLLSAGARYTHYKSRDLELAKRIERGDQLYYNAGYTYSYQHISKNKFWDNPESFQRAIDWKSNNEIYFEDVDHDGKDDTDGTTYENYLSSLNKNTDLSEQISQGNFTLEEFKAALYNRTDPILDEKIDEIWHRGSDGYYHLNNHPLFDGRITKEMLYEKFFDEENNEEKDANYNFDKNGFIQYYTDAEKQELLKPRKSHAWSPAFSATLFLTDNARVYARYIETKRMPSIYEDTIGYSIDSVGVLYQRKPEHTKSLELGYVQDLRGLFPSLRRADFRINYFKNVTRNIYDRETVDFYLMELKQFDKRTLEGIEFQTRYDQGNFFGDLSFTYNIKNKFCDKDQAYLDGAREMLYLTKYNDSIKVIPTCVNGGNASGYLKNTILPKYSIVANLGLRFLEEKLEMATRLTYHTNVKETRNRSLREAGFINGWTDNPRWQPVFLVDAYINYKYSDNLMLSFAGTNLTDRYYLDPFTRSSMPAPGRTFKFGLTMSF